LSIIKGRFSDGDISNEVRKGTFVKSFDRAFLIGLERGDFPIPKEVPMFGRMTATFP
jgi:hypothetical protein